MAAAQGSFGDTPAIGISDTSPIARAIRTIKFTPVLTTISATEAAGQTVLSVASTTGVSSTPGKNSVRIKLDNGKSHQTTITAFTTSTITVAAALPSQASAGNAVVATNNTSWEIPEAALIAGVLKGTYCGGGSGGAGGGTGGGGGGGGASSTFHDIPIYVQETPNSKSLTLTVGIGGAGGDVSSNGVAGGLTKIEDTYGVILYSLSTGRPSRDASSQAVAGGATNGGKGGDGGPLITVPLITATTTTGVEGGPVGGAAGAAGVNGGAGAASVRRGYYGTTGGAGGGGGSSTSLGGSGGADDKHGDQLTNGNASGGAGGGSFLGGAGYGGDPAAIPNGTDANGPGAGGGGGGANSFGGNGGEGVIIFSW